MSAKKITKNEYIGQWTNHVNQLVHPALDGDLPMTEFVDLKAKCMEVVTKAANKLDRENFFADHA